MCFVISYPRVRTGLAARQRLAAAMSVHHHLDDDRNHTTRHRIAHQLHSTLTMPVPFEALLPYGIMLGFFGLSGAGMAKLRTLQNGGKRGRHSLDAWDRVMMERDRRLTGYLRGQTDIPQAPEGFELNNPWKLEKRIL
ncbi:NADH:ubiquinone oxidoreductase kda subunit [Botryosphaeria dothidea]|uniref:NADH dehydrogenase [ubiquinone] 1 alpha subcomplex subunit 1 n=1 Tax=Botryosphaeria dothidea TaxID=55169 RepID=A0A8H4N4P8_9PEZI|nr:NADH:ubiquinone oxidoreductase kda subunit [Botryosphaeria dothidea]